MIRPTGEGASLVETALERSYGPFSMPFFLWPIRYNCFLDVHSKRFDRFTGSIKLQAFIRSGIPLAPAGGLLIAAGAGQCACACRAGHANWHRIMVRPGLSRQSDRQRRHLRPA